MRVCILVLFGTVLMSTSVQRNPAKENWSYDMFAVHIRIVRDIDSRGSGAVGRYAAGTDSGIVRREMGREGACRERLLFFSLNLWLFLCFLCACAL